MTTDAPFIAGRKTADDWRTFRQTLILGGDPALWNVAFSEYFEERLRLRYFNPIRILQENGTFQGEGFAILAVQCSLIEFLESTFKGMTYRYLRKGERLGQYEYVSSREVFTAFLCTRTPFAAQFDEDLAGDFYASVRCGLLHEACTRNGWRVLARGPGDAVVDRVRKSVFRDNFQRALEVCIAAYGVELPSDTALQAAFIRKFDSLAAT